MIVKILKYDSKKGMGEYQELTKNKSRLAFRYSKFKDEAMIPADAYAKINGDGELVEIKLGFFRRLMLRLKGVM